MPSKTTRLSNTRQDPSSTCRCYRRNFSVLDAEQASLQKLFHLAPYSPHRGQHPQTPARAHIYPNGHKKYLQRFFSVTFSRPERGSLQHDSYATRVPCFTTVGASLYPYELERTQQPIITRLKYLRPPISSASRSRQTERAAGPRPSSSRARLACRSVSWSRPRHGRPASAPLRCRPRLRANPR